MKINYDYYTGKDIYCDGDVEKTIIDYIDKYKEEDYEKIFETDISWPVFYHLTPIRQNILNWYPFEKEATLLEIGGGMGAITGVLCDKVEKVVSVELSKQRASAIAKRHKSRENLEIIVGNLNDITFDQKFDYITLIGVFEYAISFTNDEKPYHKFIENIKKLLKPDGKILIAIENKFGMKYFLGAPEDHTSVMFDSITGYKKSNNVRTFGREEIIKILKETGIEHSNFYYPLPDYKMPNVIFSDTVLPDEKNINTYLPYYYENSDILFDEIQVYKEIIKENKEHFKLFSNSFLIECSMEKINNNVKTAIFDSYNKQEYRDIKINSIPQTNIIENIDFKSDKINKLMYKFWTRKYNNIFDKKEEINGLYNKNLELKELISKLYKENEEKEQEKVTLQNSSNDKDILLHQINIENSILSNNLISIIDSRSYKLMKLISNLYNILFRRRYKNNKENII